MIQHALFLHCNLCVTTYSTSYKTHISDYGLYCSMYIKHRQGFQEILKFVSVSTGIRFEMGWACLPLDQEWITPKIKKSFLQITKEW